LPIPGSYHTFTLSGLPLFLIRGKDNLVRGFHNVCRHRAYEVTKKEHGKSLVLGCRYHGWSYDTRGRLVKAPEFEGVEGFDKAGNGLWELGVMVVGGLVYVQLDGREGSEKESEDGVGKLVERLSLERSRRIEEWKIEGRFNWKLAGEKSVSASVKILKRNGTKSDLSKPDIPLPTSSPSRNKPPGWRSSYRHSRI
jgi:phenylpropionate dioxygenase-like ring-hydroxylating dioxygenase large terminal subunit